MTYNKESSKKYYQKNREQRLEYAREYWLRDGVKERSRLNQKKRYEEIKRNGMWSWKN